MLLFSIFFSSVGFWFCVGFFFFSKYFENMSIGVSLSDRAESQINRFCIWVLRGVFSEMWNICMGLLQLTPFSLSGLWKVNSISRFVNKPCGVHKE